MKDKINILCATDENYAIYCLVMLTSLFENNNDVDFKVFIISDNLSNDKFKLFNNLEKRYNQKISIIEIPKDLFENFPIREGDHISLASYYRIACGILLPEEVKRVIYLDCDLIINTNIKPLWNFSLENYYMGAIIDSVSKKQSERLNLNSGSDYYNAGVLLINVEKFREYEIFDKCLKEINLNPDKFIFHDQDLLNKVLEGKIKKLPLIYNVQSALIRKDLSHNPNYEYVAFDVKEEVCKYLKKPYEFIIHYDGPIKPWSKYPFLKPAFSRIWYKYYKILGIKYQHKYAIPLKRKINVFCLNFLWFTKLKKRPDFYNS